MDYGRREMLSRTNHSAIPPASTPSNTNQSGAGVEHVRDARAESIDKPNVIGPPQTSADAHTSSTSRPDWPRKP